MSLFGGHAKSGMAARPQYGWQNNNDGGTWFVLHDIIHSLSVQILNSLQVYMRPHWKNYQAAATLVMTVTAHFIIQPTINVACACRVWQHAWLRAPTCTSSRDSSTSDALTTISWVSRLMTAVYYTNYINSKSCFFATKSCFFAIYAGVSEVALLPSSDAATLVLFLMVTAYN